MEAYTTFAQVYDLFQDNIPYDDWCFYLETLLLEYGAARCRVVDLGCGTGKISRGLRDRGYTVIGLDSSEDMLSIAAQQEDELGREADEGRILYVCQDMREMELPGPVSAMVSLCDSMNYIPTPEDLLKVFQRVYKYLIPGGVFIFDLNTEYKYREILADNTFAEDRPESSFIWQNFYDPKTRINEYDLTLFIRETYEDDDEEWDPDLSEDREDWLDEEEEQGAIYRRYTEVHFQRAYDLSEVRQAAESAGLTWAAAYNALTRDPVREDSERVYVILKKGNRRKSRKK